MDMNIHTYVCIYFKKEREWEKRQKEEGKEGVREREREEGRERRGVCVWGEGGGCEKEC